VFESLDYPVADRRMEAFYAEFPTDALPSEPHRHGAAEFIYVLSGGLRVDVEGKETGLNPGDAMYFDSSAPHSYRREGKKSCTALVVTAP
jgi:mannose-6-phosphate isomerase-like protein (cupin superfamily)